MQGTRAYRAPPPPWCRNWPSPWPLRIVFACWSAGFGAPACRAGALVCPVSWCPGAAILVPLTTARAAAIFLCRSGSATPVRPGVEVPGGENSTPAAGRARSGPAGGAYAV